MTSLNVSERLERLFRRAGIAFALAALVLTGCGKSADEYMRHAQTLLDSGSIPAAIVELKNVLQREPKNVTARLLLGKSYLELGDAASAEIELQHAREDGATPVALGKLMAETELVLGKLDGALRESAIRPDATPALKASLYSIQGLAYLGQGKAAAADEALAAGLRQDPRSTDVLAAFARYALTRRDIASARQRVDDALTIAPADVHLMALKGTVAFLGRDFSTAEESFAHVLKVQPWNLNVRTDLAQAQIAQGKLKDADANLTVVLRSAGRSSRANYLRALTAFQAHDYATAQSRIQIVLSASADNPPALLLAGATSFALNQFEQANALLSQYVTRVPQDIRGRRLLGAVQLRLGRPADAVKTLAPAVQAAGDDAELLALIGEAAGRNGDAVGAEKYLSMALERRPDSAALRTELALSKVALGQIDAAIAELEQASQQDPTAVGADIALVDTYLRNKEYDKALEAAARIQERQPASSAGFDLAGLAQASRGNRDAAQIAFLRAKELRADDPIALRGLAALAIQDGKRDVAIEYYQALVQANPKDAQATIGLAQLQFDVGNADASRAILQKAIDQDADNVTTRAALARLLMFQGKPRDALAVTEPALVKRSDQPELLQVVAQARLAAGRTEEALATFNALVRLTPQSSEAHRDLALAYSAARDMPKALAEAREAARLAPQEKTPRLVLGSLLVATKNFDEARGLAEQWAEAAPEDADYAELQGIVASSQDRPSDAVGAFARGMKLVDNNVTRTRLAFAQMKAGHADEAEKTLTSWVDVHPDDNVIRSTLAQVYLGSNQYARARDQYAEIVRQAPNDIAAENNLAWTLSVLGQKEEALQHARHAAAAAPDTPDVLDTLGVVLLQNGISAEARTALEKAAKSAPSMAPIQFHLAQALVETGEPDRARDILRSLLAGNQPFDGREQAQELLKHLRG